MTVKVLQTTGIGKTINKLSKSDVGTSTGSNMGIIKPLASRLMENWMNMLSSVAEHKIQQGVY